MRDNLPDFDQLIATTVLRHYPTAQAVYLFGSLAAGEAWPDSDADIAVLLPPAEAKQTGQLLLSPCAFELAGQLGREVDLLNLRLLSTVFQVQVIAAESLLHAADPTAAEEFEMLALSFYQKLNEERAGIIEDFRRTKRAWPV
jgi:predicted nucleotidyltransferase